ncbi:peptidylprolyl isomerase [Arenicellales bacterium IMCC57338]
MKSKIFYNPYEVQNSRIRNFAVALLMGLFCSSFASGQEMINKALVIVNESIITQADLDQQISIARLEFSASGRAPPSDSVLSSRVLEEMIVDNLLLDVAQRFGISTTDSQVNYALSVIAKQNQLSGVQFKALIEENGVRFENYRMDLRRQLTIRQLVNNRIGRTINVSSQEIDDYLLQNPYEIDEQDDKFELAQILISIPVNATEETLLALEKTANEIYQSLKGGLSFDDAIEKYLPGEGDRQNAFLGLRSRSQLPQIFIDALDNVEIGGISEMFKSPRGWHILKLIDVQQAGVSMVLQRQVRHILLRQTDLLRKEQIRSRLERIRDRILAGEDFGSVARLQSEDPSSRALGGSLGWIDAGQLPVEFEQILDALALNEVSPIFETGAGLHIAQVMGRREIDIGENLRRLEAEQILRARKTDEALEQWSQSLREDAYVEYRTPLRSE